MSLKSYVFIQIETEANPSRSGNEDLQAHTKATKAVADVVQATVQLAPDTTFRMMEVGAAHPKVNEFFKWLWEDTVDSKHPITGVVWGE